MFFVCRTHRIGQELPCMYDYIIAEGTLDERVMSKIQTKNSLLSHIIDCNKDADNFNIHGLVRRDDLPGGDEETEPDAKRKVKQN